MKKKEKIITFSSDSPGVVSGKETPEDTAEELFSLRPSGFDDYVGQKETVATLQIAISAARQRGEPLEHVLFHGPPGLGKTTLAHIIAAEMGTDLTITSGPALERGGDLIGMLTHMKRGDILFVDEIHRLPRTTEEFLYPAMEDFAVDFVFDKGIHARCHRYRLNRFVLIGATTRVGLLSAPLRDRFGIFRKFDFYTPEELALIVHRSAILLGLSVDKQCAMELARRSRGTPRIVNRLLRRVRDYAQVRYGGVITVEAINEALALEGVDDKGLTGLDRSYLETIIEYYDGGPVGIEAIGATLQEETDTLVDVVEPFLLAEGFIQRTSSGRKATDKAYRHLGINRKRKK
ncbi:MAG: Holliday junction branch migration DNA helicase RuvB [Desulfococcus sp. 4484_241]|nr:MAG: Holliday junction branch migration DNA helicase RuvB [Desulfococcus sp. 4484_241]